MSFWSADEKIPVQQTKVAIPAEHGLDYGAGQKINIIVPPTIKYFQPKESYLHFDVQLKVPDDEQPFKATLDGETGGQCLIRDIRIHSGGSGAVLLEEFQNYNTLVALKYDFETNDALRDKRAMTEGCLTETIENRGTQATSTTIYNNTKHNAFTTPYAQSGAAPWERSKTGDGEKIWGEDGNITQGSSFNQVKCLLPLHTGIFQSPKVFPALLTEGLRIEILLEDANKVYRLPDTTHPYRRLPLSAQWHSKTGKDEDLGVHPAGNWTAGTKTDTIFVQRQNSQIDLASTPFVIGQKIGFFNNVVWADKFEDGTKYNKLITDKDPIIKSLKFYAATGEDDEVGGVYGLLEIKLEEEVENTSTTVDVNWYVADDSVLDCGDDGKTQDDEMNLDYEVKNVELILQTLTMPQGYTQKLLQMMASGGAMNYDFLSFTNYKYSQLAGDRVMNMRLPLNQTKAKAILCIPTDGTIYGSRQLLAGIGPNVDLEKFPLVTGGSYPDGDIPPDYTYMESVEYWDRGNCSNRTGLVGVCDEASDYQFFYNGQLNPSRKVDLTKIGRRWGVSQQYLIELEKALSMSGINPLSFRSFQTNFCIGRALALQQGVYNTAGRDFNVQVNYGTQRTPQKNKLWMNFVSHIRRLVVQGDSIVVQI